MSIPEMMKTMRTPPMKSTLLSLGAVVLLLGGCAGELTRREGVNLILEGQLDKGLAKLKESADAAPKNADIQAEYLRQRDQGINRLLTQANSARVQGDFAAAAGHYQHVLALDPNNAAAAGGLKDLDRDRRLAEYQKEAQQRYAKGDNDGAREMLRLIQLERPNDPQANLLRQRLGEADLAKTIAGPTLNIQGRRPVTLQFRDANLKMVLDAISRATGVNILLDKDVKSDIKVTIFVKDSPVEETLDLILLQNQLEKRVLGTNSVLIYPATAAKSKDYQELKVRQFVLVNADPKQVQSMLKTILRVRDIYVDEKTNTIIIRDTNSVVRLAEKLVASIDLPESEVMLEVQLLDLDRKKTLDLGVNWPNAVNWVYPAAASTSGYTRSELAAVTRASPLYSFLPSLGGTLKALETDGDTRVLATPRIRAKSKEKARIMIGNRTPIISSAAVPSTGAVGSAAVYNTNIQYLDTGIKLEVEPNVYSDGEVSIKITLEVSDLGTKYENPNTGTLAYATTTNNATTTLRLKDGETQVLAGLLRSSTSNAGGNKVPGLGDVPLVGRLFGIQSDNWQNRELVLAITPRIVRNSQPNDAEIVEMWSGTEATVRYDSFQKGPAKQPVATIAQAQPKAPVEVVEVVANVENTAPPSPPVAGAAGALRPLIVAPKDAKVGEVISVSIELPALEAGVNSMSFALKYEADKMLPVKVTEGNIGTRADSKTTFKSDIDPGASQVMGVIQLEGNGLATTGGTLAVAQFRVISPGGASLTTTSISAVSLENKPVQVVTPPPHQLNLSRR
jgi:general secretion pathway protein D